MRKQSELTRAVRAFLPYGGLIADVVQVASRNAKEATRILGPADKGERAVDMHRGIRNEWDRLCSLPNSPMVLREGKRGLDYVVFRGDLEFALRWGHRQGGSISRNDTLPTRYMHEQGLLSYDWGVEKTINDLLVLTISFTIENDFTMAGKLCWYVGQIDLVRELVDGLDFLCPPLAQFAAPSQELWTEDPQVIVRAREDDANRWARELRRIRRTG